MALDASADAPAGDVIAAIIEVDSMLRRIHHTGGGDTAELDALLDVTSEEDARQVLDGYCTLIYLFMIWFGQGFAAEGKDPLGEVIPVVVTGLCRMPRHVRPSAIPAMVGLLTAVTVGLKPQLWRMQYGPWQYDELPALQATVCLLADWINNVHDDPDAALRMITDLCERAEADNAGNE